MGVYISYTYLNFMHHTRKDNFTLLSHTQACGIPTWSCNKKVTQIQKNKHVQRGQKTKVPLGILINVRFLLVYKNFIFEIHSNSCENLCVIFCSTSQVASSTWWFLQKPLISRICLFLSRLTMYLKSKLVTFYRLDYSQPPHCPLLTHDLSH